MKIFVRMLMLSAVLAVVSTSWLGCVVDNGTGPSSGTAPRITTSTLPSGTAGTSYSQTLRASGDAPITWSLESGALPAGLNLLRSGTISGTPTTAGTYSFSVKASNSAGNDTKSLSITIAAGSTTPITPTTYSLDGVWASDGGTRITVIGSTGTFSALGSFPADYMSNAVEKGYIAVGKQIWWNMTRTGDLTWSGQHLTITYNESNLKIATGTSSRSCTFTLSADRQTLTPSIGGVTYTRYQ
jgi:hypothetical protein